MGYLFILIYIGIILLVIELCTNIVELTGLEKPVARFQVISMLTNTGFTTGESELIITHPIRRRLGAFLILFGAFSLAVIISAISGILQKNFHIQEVGIIAGILLLLLLILKLPFMHKKLKKKLHQEMEKSYKLEELPIKDVLLQNDEDDFMEIHVHEESGLIGKTIKDVIKTEEDINVLFIMRGEVMIRHERHDEKIREGDMIYLYGDKDCLQRKFASEIEAHKEKLEEKAEAKNNTPL
ncbi:TrkA C-terminal domain-containing protein [Bacillus sp. B-jedd]|uniref:TrkA C-terminal domain-containing protein n=1 Tax=Bacillus sp. B-jedd TaxID=1476857 RepID=UPI0005157289|nr:TrkA C-terminal domain-containing protein [Bacillus sp. B-jedd]CEG25626.1 TrkA-C domain protein [Bacillus sp. B-jedd]